MRSNLKTMGEARRKKLAGCYPEPAKESNKRIVTVSPNGRGSGKSVLSLLTLAMSMGMPDLVTSRKRGVMK